MVPAMEKEIAVILVNYNGKRYNDNCIDSLLRSTIADRLAVIVVDNASTDGSLEALEERWAQDGRVQIVPLDRNYGFSRANNEGIRFAMRQGISCYLLLNNDTEIAPDAIERMYRCHLQTGGIVVPRILYADDREKLWCAGGSFTPIVRKAVQRGLNERAEGRYDRDEDCGFANGCALFLSREIVEKTGLLDERFFLYYEDTEYSMRAVRLGIRIRYCAGARVYHRVNGSTLGNERPENAYYITRNWLLCNFLHRRDACFRGGRYPLFLLYFICNRAAWALIWWIGGRGSMVRAMRRGVRDHRRGQYGQITDL